MLNTSFAMQVKGDLVIVHPSRTWDPLGVAREGILKAVAAAKVQGTKIYILKHNDLDIFENENYHYDPIFGSWSFRNDQGFKYPSDIDSYYISDDDFIKVSSEGGENEIILSSKEVTVVGGYLEHCLAKAVSDLVFNNSKNSEKLKVNLYLPGIFAHKTNEELPDDFNILDLWPYPTNPGFINLERQVSTYSLCPSSRIVGNDMIKYGGDVPSLGSGLLENSKIDISCNDELIDTYQLGDISRNSFQLNFVTD